MRIHGVSESDVVEGLAVHLCPEALTGAETVWVCGHPCSSPVKGNHTFVVLLRIGQQVILTPVFSTPKFYRCQVRGKSGHPGWVDGPTFFDPCQLVVATVDAVVSSARAAHDHSEPLSRNRVNALGLEAMRAAVRRRLGGEVPDDTVA
jgi:hypothetical protein